MSIKERIDSDLKKALLANDKTTATTLRGLKSVILDAEIAEGKRDTGLSDDAVSQLLAKEVKKRRESIALFEQGGRADMAAAEQAEIACIETYLPEAMSEDDIKTLIDTTIAGMGEVTMQQMGQVIGQVKVKAGPTADGALIARLVKDKLSA